MLLITAIFAVLCILPSVLTQMGIILPQSVIENLEASERVGVVDLGHDNNVYLIYPLAALRILKLPLPTSSGSGTAPPVLHALAVMRSPAPAVPFYTGPSHTTANITTCQERPKLGLGERQVTPQTSSQPARACLSPLKAAPLSTPSLSMPSDKTSPSPAGTLPSGGAEQAQSTCNVNFPGLKTDSLPAPHLKSSVETPAAPLVSTSLLASAAGSNMSLSDGIKSTGQLEHSSNQSKTPGVINASAEAVNVQLPSGASSVSETDLLSAFETIRDLLAGQEPTAVACSTAPKASTDELIRQLMTFIPGQAADTNVQVPTNQLPCGLSADDDGAQNPAGGKGAITIPDFAGSSVGFRSQDDDLVPAAVPAVASPSQAATSASLVQIYNSQATAAVQHLDSLKQPAGAPAPLNYESCYPPFPMAGLQTVAASSQWAGTGGGTCSHHLQPSNQGFSAQMSKHDVLSELRKPEVEQQRERGGGCAWKTDTEMGDNERAQAGGSCSDRPTSSRDSLILSEEVGSNFGAFAGPNVVKRKFNEAQSESEMEHRPFPEDNVCGDPLGRQNQGGRGRFEKGGCSWTRPDGSDWQEESRGRSGGQGEVGCSKQHDWVDDRPQGLLLHGAQQLEPDSQSGWNGAFACARLVEGGSSHRHTSGGRACEGREGSQEVHQQFTNCKNGSDRWPQHIPQQSDPGGMTGGPHLPHQQQPSHLGLQVGVCVEGGRNNPLLPQLWPGHDGRTGQDRQGGFSSREEQPFDWSQWPCPGAAGGYHPAASGKVPIIRHTEMERVVPPLPPPPHPPPPLPPPPHPPPPLPQHNTVQWPQQGYSLQPPPPPQPQIPPLVGGVFVHGPVLQQCPPKGWGVQPGWALQQDAGQQQPWGAGTIGAPRDGSMVPPPPMWGSGVPQHDRQRSRY